jgi:ABC-type glycerol-3-phosphate transport system substrate-binding protein
VNTRRLVSSILLAGVVGGGMAACSSSPSSSAPKPSPSTSATSSASSSAAQAIKANWTAFFNAKTPVARRVALLQDGSQFASVIRAQAGGGLAALASAQVTKVTVTSPTQAAVTYNILVDGTPELKGQSGTAVLQDGTWKVGVTSFCDLLTLENGGNSSKLPAACKAST